MTGLPASRPLLSVAREAGVSLRTTQRWVARYRDGGLRALARDDRADCGKRRAISPKLIEFVEGLALSPTAAADLGDPSGGEARLRLGRASLYPARIPCGAWSVLSRPAWRLSTAREPSDTLIDLTLFCAGRPTRRTR